MSRKNNLRSLIEKHSRYLQKLKEQQASFGLYTPPHILTEIEDNETVLARLHAEYEELANPKEGDIQDNFITSGETTPKIFLSYSSEDRLSVTRLANDLRSVSLFVWLDEWEVKVGDQITQKIQEGLTDCNYLAVWLTTNSVLSDWVEREWQTKYYEEILNRRVVVLPLLAENCNIPILLRDKKFADFRYNYQEGLQELLAVFGV